MRVGGVKEFDLNVLLGRLGDLDYLQTTNSAWT